MTRRFRPTLHSVDRRLLWMSSKPCFQRTNRTVRIIDDVYDFVQPVSLYVVICYGNYGIYKKAIFLGVYGGQMPSKTRNRIEFLRSRAETPQQNSDQKPDEKTRRKSGAKSSGGIAGVRADDFDRRL